MNESLHKNVRAAAIAGWWTLLVGVLFNVFLAAMFAIALHVRPAWITSVWGGVSWDAMQTVMLWMLGTFRLILWVILLVVVWLSIWSCKLGRLQ